MEDSLMDSDEEGDTTTEQDPKFIDNNVDVTQETKVVILGFIDMYGTTKPGENLVTRLDIAEIYSSKIYLKYILLFYSLWTVKHVLHAFNHY